MSREELATILCVDDEPRIVDGLAVHLRREYQVLRANNGISALQVLKDKGAPAVVLSDMRMPGMDGATLLKHVKQLCPETTRILLTGEPGRDAAITAVNDGQIFRFLTKPCPPDQLRSAIEAGVAHHRLLIAEKVLLQQTLIGCIKALVDILAITHPVAFGRATRVKRLATELSALSGKPNFWQLEAAAMLSQIGCISLPTELVEKLCHGKPLTREERVLADAAPLVAQKLLGRIPRLEPVMEILAACAQPSVDLPDGLIKLGAGVLSLVLEYDAQVAQGHGAAVAVSVVRAQAARFDSKLVENLESLVGLGAGTPEPEVKEIAVGRLTSGMVFMDDLRTPTGTLLVPRGFEVTETFLERARNFGDGIQYERVRVMVPAKSIA